MEDELIQIEDGCWDYYSGLPNPKWYEQTFSDSLEED